MPVVRAPTYTAPVSSSARPARTSGAPARVTSHRRRVTDSVLRLAPVTSLPKLSVAVTVIGHIADSPFNVGRHSRAVKRQVAPLQLPDSVWPPPPGSPSTSLC